MAEGVVAGIDNAAAGTAAARPVSSNPAAPAVSAIRRMRCMVSVLSMRRAGGSGLRAGRTRLSRGC